MNTVEREATGRRKHHAFGEGLAQAIAHWTGSSAAFLMAAGIILVWGITGPLFHFSDTWQLVINTGTTVVTFLMVFLIQRSQNKDAIAIQVKLDELLAAMEGASNRIVSAEDLSEEELRSLKSRYQSFADRSSAGPATRAAGSVEDVEDSDAASDRPKPAKRPTNRRAKRRAVRQSAS